MEGYNSESFGSGNRTQEGRQSQMDNLPRRFGHAEGEVMDFYPKILCPHCQEFLQFTNRSKGLEPSCPSGWTLSNEDKAVINLQIMNQYTPFFKLEHPIDAP
jgi:hypothetical protein